MIGDSPSDIQAARQAAAAAIAFANKPTKRDRLAALHPDATVDRMADLTAEQLPDGRSSSAGDRH